MSATTEFTDWQVKLHAEGYAWLQVLLLIICEFAKAG